MADFFKQHWAYIGGAVLLHALFAAIFGLTMLNMQRNAPVPQLAIQAVIVDPAALARAAASQPKPQPQKDDKKDDQKKEQELAQQREREQEEQRQRDAAEQERQQQETQKREAEQRAEQERQVELKQRQETEQRRLAEEQQLRERQEAERKKAAAEAEKQKQAEAERNRVAEIERKQKEAAEQRRKADEARTQQARESDLQKQLEEEEGTTAARGSPAMAQYVAMVQQHVQRRWIRPLSAIEGLECEVRVAQTPAGVVLSATVGKCNGDAAVKQSIEAAVLKSSPLPSPPDPRMFERNLVFIFRPTA